MEDALSEQGAACHLRYTQKEESEGDGYAIDEVVSWKLQDERGGHLIETEPRILPLNSVG